MPNGQVGEARRDSQSAGGSEVFAKIARGEKGLAKAILSQVLQFSKNEFSDWEMEQDEMTEKMLPDVSTFMGVDLNDGRLAEQLAAKVHHGVGAPRWRDFSFTSLANDLAAGTETQARGEKGCQPKREWLWRQASRSFRARRAG